MPPLDPRQPEPSGILPPEGMPMPVMGEAAGPRTPRDMAAQVAAIRGATATPTEDGGAILDLEPGLEGEIVPGPREHAENLADGLEDAVLAKVAQEVLEGIEADESSCGGYFDQVKQGIALLGLEAKEASDPFDGASGAVHPMLLQAVIRFVANARGELQPADGPAKIKTEATPEPALAAIAGRKAKWLNYYLTVEDRGYYPDCDAGWLQLALYGSIFRKVYDDPVTGKPRSRHLTPLQLLVSWHAPDLESALRLTHIDTISTAEAIRRQMAGYYREGPRFDQSSYEEDTPERAARIRDEKRTPSDREEDAEQVHMHSHVLLDPALYGLPEDGPEGLPLPYIVTVDRRTEEVLRIERDWKDGDPLFLRAQTYAHYLLHPGLGFYGWSYVSMMASVTNTASTLWRQAINAFLLHSFPGGFRTKGMRPESESMSVGPGEFQEIDTGGLPIEQAIMPLPYRDVPTSFPALFETVLSAGQTLGGTQELQVGEGRQDAPVGTTLAMLEAAIKPTAAIFKRLHEAQGHELRMIAERFGRDEGATYPYLVDGKRGQAIAADFRDVADVVPVSDPNIPTQTQRLTQAQGVLQLAMGSGGIIDMRAALEDMLVTMGRSPIEIERLMPKAKQGEPADVATEFARALKGEPLAVGPEQDHWAHVQAHLPLLQTDLPPPILSALMSHVGDHVAAWYRQQAEMAMAQAGVPLPAPDQPMPPAIEQAMSRAVAQASNDIVTKLGGMLGSGGDPAKAAEIKYKYEELKFKNADSQRKAEETARQDQTELLKLRQESLDAKAERELRERELEMDMRKTVMASIAKAGEQHQAGRHAMSLHEGKHKAGLEAQRQKHEHGLEATGHSQVHDASMSAVERQHAAATAQAEREHAAGLAEAERRARMQESMMGHIASAGSQAADQRHQVGIKAMDHQHSQAEAERARKHELGIVTGDRKHQAGIAAMGHQAALEKTKLAGDTTLKAAKLKGAAKPAGAKPKAKPKA